MDEKMIYNDLKSKVYNVLSDVVFENLNQKDVPVEEQKKLMDQAIEWWQTHFWEE